MLQVRTILEIGAIRLIGARPRSEEEDAALTAACDALQQMLDAGFEFGFVEADRRFHSTIVELSRNDRLIATYHRAPLPLSPSRIVDPEERRRAALKTITEHREIQRLLTERRISECIEQLEQHLSTSHQLAPMY